MNGRFTVDGSAELEGRLRRTCEEVCRQILTRLPPKLVEALALGGGYGRGEGGVLKTENGDAPYNDLEFYVFLRGNRIWNEIKYAGVLHELGESLSLEAGAQVEFKIESLERWKKGPPSMFSYDLVARHRVVLGDEAFLQDCRAHLDADAIPLAEATRLMFNRCSGLLLARALLEKGNLSNKESDFIGRNLAKMQLALGDAALTCFGKYHWSARERNRRLRRLPGTEVLPWLPVVRAEHEAGLDFKLHPRRDSRCLEEFAREHRRLTALALQFWLWLENQRLQQHFCSAADYALSPVDKCPEMPAWRNCFVNVRAFGWQTLVSGAAWRYPRARLCNVLALLLWHAEGAAQRPFLRRLQEDLRTDAPDWAGLVNVFKQSWPRYG